LLSVAASTGCAVEEKVGGGKIHSDPTDLNKKGNPKPHNQSDGLPHVCKLDSWEPVETRVKRKENLKTSVCQIHMCIAVRCPDALIDCYGKRLLAGVSPKSSM
jgi:hypothetical protein